MAETTPIYWATTQKDRPKTKRYSTVHLTEEGSDKTLCNKLIPKSTGEVEITRGVSELPKGIVPKNRNKTCSWCITRFPEAN